MCIQVTCETADSESVSLNGTESLRFYEVSRDGDAADLWVHIDQQSSIGVSRVYKRMQKKYVHFAPIS